MGRQVPVKCVTGEGGGENSVGLMNGLGLLENRLQVADGRGGRMRNRFRSGCEQSSTRFNYTPELETRKFPANSTILDSNEK